MRKYRNLKDEMPGLPAVQRPFVNEQYTRKAYIWVSNWLALNEGRFQPNSGEIWGALQYGKADILAPVLRKAATGAGFNFDDMLKAFADNDLIITDRNNHYTSYMAVNRVKAEYVTLKINLTHTEFAWYEDGQE